LLTKIYELLSSEKLQRSISENAFKKVKEEYSIERYTQKMLDIYKDLSGTQ